MDTNITEIMDTRIKGNMDTSITGNMDIIKENIMENVHKHSGNCKNNTSLWRTIQVNGQIKLTKMHMAMTYFRLI